MGLFHILGGLAKAALPAVGTAIGGPVGGAIGAGLAGALSGASNKHAIGAQNDALQLGLTNAENVFNGQNAQNQGNFNPFITGGQKAFGAEQDLLGLNGNGAAGSAIDALKASPLYQSLFNTGRDSVLAAGSATGGLRGGNINGALYNNASQTLAQVIQNQLSNLGGLSSQGLGAAGTLGSLGAQNAGSLADLLVGSGKVNAGAIGNQQAVDNTTQNGLASAFSGNGVQDQIVSLLKGLGIGGSNSSGSAGVSNILKGIGLGSPTYGGGSQGNLPGVLSLSGISGGGINNTNPNGLAAF